MVRTYDAVVRKGRLKLHGSLEGVDHARAVVLVLEDRPKGDASGLEALLDSAGAIKKGPDPVRYQKAVRSEWHRRRK